MAIIGDAQRIAVLADEDRRLRLDETVGTPVDALGREVRERVLAHDTTSNFLALDRATRTVRPWVDAHIDAIFSDPAANAAADQLGMELPARFVLPRCRYLGGFADHPEPVEGIELVGIAPLVIVAYQRGGEPLFGIPGDTIAGLTVEGTGEIAQRVTLPRVLTLGPLAWGVKKDIARAFFVVETNMGVDAFFETSAATPQELRARLEPIMRDFAAESPAAQTSEAADDPVQRLRDFAALRDDGILTEEEFEQEKRLLLNAMRERSG